ncbi:hypothetical protein BH10PSE12_BH10PSE12_32250 [soil metagenome]
MNYDALRHAADTMGLLFLGLLYLIALWLALRPSARGRCREASEIPFRNERLHDD